MTTISSITNPFRWKKSSIEELQVPKSILESLFIDYEIQNNFPRKPLVFLDKKLESSIAAWVAFICLFDWTRTILIVYETVEVFELWVHYITQTIPSEYRRIIDLGNYTKEDYEEWHQAHKNNNEAVDFPLFVFIDLANCCRQFPFFDNVKGCVPCVTDSDEVEALLEREPPRENDSRLPTPRSYPFDNIGEQLCFTGSAPICELENFEFGSIFFPYTKNWDRVIFTLEGMDFVNHPEIVYPLNALHTLKRGFVINENFLEYDQNDESSYKPLLSLFSMVSDNDLISGNRDSLCDAYSLIFLLKDLFYMVFFNETVTNELLISVFKNNMNTLPVERKRSNRPFSSSSVSNPKEKKVIENPSSSSTSSSTSSTSSSSFSSSSSSSSLSLSSARREVDFFEVTFVSMDGHIYTQVSKVFDDYGIIILRDLDCSEILSEEDDRISKIRSNFKIQVYRDPYPRWVHDRKMNTLIHYLNHYYTRQFYLIIDDEQLESIEDKVVNTTLLNYEECRCENLTSKDTLVIFNVYDTFRRKVQLEKLRCKIIFVCFEKTKEIVVASNLLYKKYYNNFDVKRRIAHAPHKIHACHPTPTTPNEFFLKMSPLIYYNAKSVPFLNFGLYMQQIRKDVYAQLCVEQASVYECITRYNKLYMLKKGYYEILYPVMSEAESRCIRKYNEACKIGNASQKSRAYKEYLECKTVRPKIRDCIFADPEIRALIKETYIEIKKINLVYESRLGFSEAVSFYSEENAQFRQNVIAYRSQNPPPLPISSKKDTRSKREKRDEAEALLYGKGTSYYSVPCFPCGHLFSSMKRYRNHIKTKDHIFNTEIDNYERQFLENPVEGYSCPASREPLCKLCNKSYPTRVKLLIHYKGKKHSNNLKLKNNSIKKCDACRVEFETPVDKEDHESDMAHQSNIFVFTCFLCENKRVGIEDYKVHLTQCFSFAKNNNLSFVENYDVAFDENYCFICKYQCMDFRRFKVHFESSGHIDNVEKYRREQSERTTAYQRDCAMPTLSDDCFRIYADKWFIFGTMVFDLYNENLKTYGDDHIIYSHYSRLENHLDSMNISRFATLQSIAKCINPMDHEFFYSDDGFSAVLVCTMHTKVGIIGYFGTNVLAALSKACSKLFIRENSTGFGAYFDYAPRTLIPFFKTIAEKIRHKCEINRPFKRHIINRRGFFYVSIKIYK